MPNVATSIRTVLCLSALAFASVPGGASAERDERPAVTRVVEPLGAAAGSVAGDAAGRAPTRVVDAALSRAAGVPPAPDEPPETALALRSEAPAADVSPRSCRWPGAATLAAILPVAADNGSHASGVVFAPGKVLTAAHAVQGAGRFFVRIGEDFRLATLLFVDHATDLAVLSVDTPGIEPIALADHDPSDRQPVWAAGYPRAQAMATSVGVFQKHRDGALHTSAPIDSGQSGGGLLACSRGTYRLVGLLRGYGAYLSGDRYVKLENHSVSVAVSTIQRFLDAYR